MSDSPQAEVLFERIGPHVAVVTLNRPDVHNAVNGALTRQLGALTVRIEQDPDIRVAVLAARGPSFCAGMDLKVVAQGGMDEVVIGDAGFAGFVLASKSKPWIAAVHGLALGGGAELALACDMIIAGKQAQFGLPEVKRGLIAGAGGCIRIAHNLPRALAIELVTTGARLSAERAVAFGMANRLVEPGEELSAALEIAAAIAENAPTAVRESVRLTRYAADHSEDDALALQQEAIAKVLASPDLAEGARAFVEKRAPVWTA
jgi:enoyl-CoA hydratase